MTCKAFRSVRHRHLVVHPRPWTRQDGENAGVRCLSALYFLARNLEHAKLVDVELLLKSNVPGVNKSYMRVLKSGSSQLSGIAAFRLGQQDGPGNKVVLPRVQRWLIPRMTGLRTLSLEAVLATSLGHLSCLRHLVLNVRWQHTLPGFLETLPSGLQTLALQGYVQSSHCSNFHTGGGKKYVVVRGMYRPNHPSVVHVAHIKRLQCLALRNLPNLECHVTLPDGCLLHVQVGNPAYALPDEASRMTSAAVPMWGTDSYHKFLEEFPNIKVLTIAPGFDRKTPLLALDAAALSPAKHLTMLRVLDAALLDGKVRLLLPSCVKLRSLVLVAPKVRLGFECSAESASLLNDMKIACACFKCIPAEPDGSKDGIQYLNEEVAPNLQDGLSLRQKFVGTTEEGEALKCIYIHQKSRKKDLLAADLLYNRCLCGCCLACLKLDGKWLPDS